MVSCHGTPRVTHVTRREAVGGAICAVSAACLASTAQIAIPLAADHVRLIIFIVANLSLVVHIRAAMVPAAVEVDSRPGAIRAQRSAGKGEACTAAVAAVLRLQRAFHVRVAVQRSLAATKLQCRMRVIMARHVLGARRASLSDRQAVANRRCRAAALAAVRKFEASSAATKLQGHVRRLAACRALGAVMRTMAELGAAERTAKLAKARRLIEHRFAAIKLQAYWRAALARGAVAERRSVLVSERQHSRASIAQRASSYLARGQVGAAAAVAVAGGTAAHVSLDAMPAEVAALVAAVRLQGRWRRRIQGRWRAKREQAERAELEEKLALAEAHEVAVRQARELKQAQVAMFLEMEQTVTALTTELAAAREDVKDVKATVDETTLAEKEPHATNVPVPTQNIMTCGGCEKDEDTVYGHLTALKRNGKEIGVYNMETEEFRIGRCECMHHPHTARSSHCCPSERSFTNPPEFAHDCVTGTLSSATSRSVCSRCRGFMRSSKLMPTARCVSLLLPCQPMMCPRLTYEPSPLHSAGVAGEPECWRPHAAQQ